jgi:hypothetical protein
MTNNPDHQTTSESRSINERTLTTTMIAQPIACQQKPASSPSLQSTERSLCFRPEVQAQFPTVFGCSQQSSQGIAAKLLHQIIGSPTPYPDWISSFPLAQRLKMFTLWVDSRPHADFARETSLEVMVPLELAAGIAWKSGMPEAMAFSIWLRHVSSNRGSLWILNRRQLDPCPRSGFLSLLPVNGQVSVDALHWFLEIEDPCDEWLATWNVLFGIPDLGRYIPEPRTEEEKEEWAGLGVGPFFVPVSTLLEVIMQESYCRATWLQEYVLENGRKRLPKFGEEDNGRAVKKWLRLLSGVLDLWDQFYAELEANSPECLNPAY